MKIFLTLSIIFLIVSFPVFAQTKTPGTSTPTPESNDLINKLKQIEIFKEKIATKVAQVREADKGVATGQIKSIENNNIVIITINGEKKLNISEDTLIFKFENKAKKEIKSDSLKKDITISAFGNYNENKDIILSKFIYIEDYLERIAGKIANLDSSNFTFTVKAKDGDQLIDIEKNTITNLYKPGSKPQKTGFSKFKIGDTVFIMAKKNPKENNRYSGVRIIILPIVELSPTPTKTPTDTPTPKIK